MKNKGFTLIEVIISVAALSILSIYLVQLFIKADNLNKRAYELDQSVVITQNILELIEQADTPLVKANELYSLIWEKSNAGYDSILYLDDGFQSTASKEQSAYALNISAKELKNDINGKNLYEISMVINRASNLPLEKKLDQVVYSLSSTKLLKSWGR